MSIHKDTIERILKDHNMHVSKVVEGDNAIRFDACCIGHAASLCIPLRLNGYSFHRVGIAFKVFKPEYLYEPKIETVTNDGLIWKVTFDSKVSDWAMECCDISDMDTYQDLIQEFEQRIIEGIFGYGPRVKAVQWDQDILMIWRRE